MMELEQKLNINFKLSNQLTEIDDDVNYSDKLLGHVNKNKGSNNKKASEQINTAML